MCKYETQRNFSLIYSYFYIEFTISNEFVKTPACACDQIKTLEVFIKAFNMLSFNLIYQNRITCKNELYCIYVVKKS